MQVGIDAIGYCSFDDSCTLLPSEIWDSAGYVRDPQAWEGWYLVQPHFFYGPSFWKNSGTSAPAYYSENRTERRFEQFGAVDFYIPHTAATDQNVNGILNKGIAGITQAT